MAATPLPPTSVIRELVTRLLDRGFQHATQATLEAIGRSTTSGVIRQRLAELDAEVARLTEAHQPLTASNPVVRALIADLDDTMRGNAALVNGAATTVQETSAVNAGALTRQLALPGYSDAQLLSIGIRWNVPDVNALARVLDYTSTPAFAERLARYRGGIVDLVQQIALNGIASGQNPVTTARELRMAVENMPAGYANSLMRTLQLTSYRDAAVIHQVANADIIDYVVRVATLDSRTCMSCVALHGEQLEPGERVDDHDQGRCIGVPVVKGREVDVESGEDWFNSQDEGNQRDQMGNANFEAWKAGAITLSDFPEHYSDPVYGSMIREASLKGMLGDAAKDYYGR